MLETATPRLLVVTGGPGAGKTALLEIVRRNYGEQVVVLPEAASILFSGGFPRRTTDAGKRAAQRAIFRVQSELERLALEERAAPVVLCDRGTVDGAAYWPGEPEGLFREVGSTLERELAHYSAVLHLRTPEDGKGYNHANPVRIETAREARAVDDRILEVWQAHPQRFVIDSTDDFLHKVSRALAIVDAQLGAPRKGGILR